MSKGKKKNERQDPFDLLDLSIVSKLFDKDLYLDISSDKEIRRSTRGASKLWRKEPNKLFFPALRLVGLNESFRAHVDQIKHLMKEVKRTQWGKAYYKELEDDNEIVRGERVDPAGFFINQTWASLLKEKVKERNVDAIDVYTKYFSRESVRDIPKKNKEVFNSLSTEEISTIIGLYHTMKNKKDTVSWRDETDKTISKVSEPPTGEKKKRRKKKKRSPKKNKKTADKKKKETPSGGKKKKETTPLPPSPPPSGEEAVIKELPKSIDHETEYRGAILDMAKLAKKHNRKYETRTVFLIPTNWEGSWIEPITSKFVTFPKTSQISSIDLSVMKTTLKSKRKGKKKESTKYYTTLDQSFPVASQSFETLYDAVLAIHNHVVEMNENIPVYLATAMEKLKIAKQVREVETSSSGNGSSTTVEPPPVTSAPSPPVKITGAKRKSNSPQSDGPKNKKRRTEQPTAEEEQEEEVVVGSPESEFPPITSGMRKNSQRPRNIRRR